MKLTWKDDVASNGWWIQTERVRGEGIFYYLEGLSPSDRAALKDFEDTRYIPQLGWYADDGGKKTLKAEAQDLADFIEAGGPIDA